MEQSDKWPTVSISSVLIHSTKRNADKTLGYNNLKAVNKVHGMIPMKQRVHGDNIERCKIVKNNWFAYNPMRVNVGSICQWREEDNCIVSPDYVVFKCDGKKMAPAYMFQIIKSSIWDHYVKRAGAGSVRVRIYFKDLSPLRIPLPPLPEQKKIASILTTVDDKISSIEHQIQQTEQLKKGLMEKLLTEGIGHTEFKDTKIGRIPKGWDVKPLKALAKVERGKFQHRPRNDPRFYGGDYPFVQTGDVGKSKGRLTSYSQSLNEEGLTKSRLFPKGTIIITIAANIGDTAIASFDVAFPDSLVGIIAGEKMDSIFLEFYLRTQKNYLNKLATVNAQKNINLETLRPLSIPLPPLSEQKQIANILSTVDDKIEVLTQKKSEYQTLKKGLSQQLLTGQMRVKV